MQSFHFTHSTKKVEKFQLPSLRFASIIEGTQGGHYKTGTRGVCGEKEHKLGLLGAQRAFPRRAHKAGEQGVHARRVQREGAQEGHIRRARASNEYVLGGHIKRACKEGTQGGHAKRARKESTLGDCRGKAHKEGTYGGHGHQMSTSKEGI
jgi:hypothetical protein